MAFQPLRIMLNKLENAMMRQFATKRFTWHSPKYAERTENMPKEQIGKGQDVVERAQERLDRIEKTGATFLVTDLGVAMTFVRVAGDAAEDSGKKTQPGKCPPRL